MADSPKLQVPQINRIRAKDAHTADALQSIVDNINANTTPAAGNRITPPNRRT